MAFRDDDRAQAIQIGAVLLFATLVIAFSLYQAFVVPNQNEQVELNHNVELQSQLQELRNAIHAVPGGDPGSAVSIPLGTSYPARLIALNPPPAVGHLRTIGTTNPQVHLTITNATTGGETGDVWNGSTRRYNTGGIRYVPGYHEYQSPPRTVYENSVLYNRFAEQTLSLTPQSLISGDRISIVTLNGSFDRASSQSTTVDIEAISTSERTISVSGGSGPITLNVTTQLSPARWRTLLAEEDNVENVSLAADTDAVPDPFRRVRISLAPGEYTLRMTKVGVGTGTTGEPAAYLTTVAGTDSSLVQGQRQRIVLEVRDAYNNPVSNVTVAGDVQGSGILQQPTAISDGGGRVAFTYVTTEATTTGTHQLQFSLGTVGPTFDGQRGTDVTVNVTVTERNEGGRNATYDLNWDRPPFPSRITSESLGSATVPRGTPFSARATDGSRNVTFATVDYAVGNATVARVVPSRGETNATGINTTNIVRRQDGRTRLYATSGGAGDTINYTFDRLLYDDFEEETLRATGWRYDDNDHGGAGGVKAIGGAADSGSRVAYINGSGGATGTRHLQMTYPINTTAYDTLTITYVARETSAVDDPDTPGSGSSYLSSEDLKLEYRSADGDWVTVDTVTSVVDGEDRSYYRRVLIQNITNVSHDQFVLRFTQGETTNVDEWQIDTLDVVGVSSEPVADLNGDPYAAFTYSPEEPSVGQTVTFDASWSDDPDDNIMSYEWDWDDDGVYEGSGETATHTFTNNETYQVTLRVTDRGASETVTQAVNVTSGVQGSPIQFVEGTEGLLYNQDEAPTFDIENVGTEAATISSIRITTNATDPDWIYEQNGGSTKQSREVYIDSNDIGYLEAATGNNENNDGYTLGSTVELSDEASLSSGEQATVSLYRFYQQTGGPSGAVDMSGYQVTVTLTLSDSSSTTFSFVVPES
ncbi:MAG: PKD domain-containing protein [Halorhabdus sp.]